MSPKSIVVVGSSFNALMMSLQLAKTNPGQKIIILEKEPMLGGLYRNFHYENGIVFDIDVHAYTETEVPEIDELFLSLLPKDEWEYLEGTHRDISGVYFNGKLQSNTPYPDLRSYSTDDKAEFLGDLFSSMANDIDPTHYSNAHDFLESKFGKAINDKVLSPIMEKHYHRSSKEMDPMATFTVPITRMVIYDEDIIADLMQSSKIRSRLAFPDQFSLPSCYLRKSRLLYPKKYGIENLVKILEQKLVDHGVKIYRETQIESIEYDQKEIKSVLIKGKSGEWQEEVEHLCWSAGLPSLASQLGLNFNGPAKPYSNAVFVNLILDKKPLCEDMYYFYCFDSDFRTFRVVNYSSYCPGAKTDLGYPLCVTLCPKEGEEFNYEERAIEELKRMKVITDHKVNFIRSERIERGFPLATAECIKHMDNLREQINSKRLGNLSATGMLAKKGLFYLNDVLVDAFQSIKAVTKCVSK